MESSAMAKAVSRLGIAINLAVRNSMRRPDTIRCCDSIRPLTTEATGSKSRVFLFTETDVQSEESLKALFERWQAHYNLGKDWSRHEKTRRFNVFKQTAEFVHDRNKRGLSKTPALNVFAARTREELYNAHASIVLEKDFCIPRGTFAERLKLWHDLPTRLRGTFIDPWRSLRWIQKL